MIPNREQIADLETTAAWGKRPRKHAAANNALKRVAWLGILTQLERNRSSRLRQD
jgi:hypothetical protein